LTSVNALLRFGTNPNDGTYPLWTTGLALDSHGNLFGITEYGGSVNGGTPNGKLTFDKLGNLYGTTLGGGAGDVGTVFELSLGSSGIWTDTVLYSFCPSGVGCLDGLFPEQGVIFDKFGNLYGTTTEGGSTGNGVIFKLSPGASWTQTVLYTFSAPPGTRLEYSFTGPLSIDPSDDLYTTADWLNSQGLWGDGKLYRLTSNGKVGIYPFDGKNGDGPFSGVILDAKRQVLYGTTSQANNDSGDVFQITAHGKETVLYTFCHQSGCTDGSFPGGLVEDESGNLYGATQVGGAYDLGVVFEITP
jgi:uncharacterized repeat protein (TIGR03803 family)